MNRILCEKKLLGDNTTICDCVDCKNIVPKLPLTALPGHNVHFSSKTDDWSTPQDFFDELNKEFKFDLDVCASKENTKCHKWINKEDDGLKTSWKEYRCFMNPPYGREIGKWVKKASEHKGLVVCLLPARTDTKYFHECIYKNPRATIRFLKGRLKFGGSKNSAPFPSMVVIFSSLLSPHSPIK